MKNLKLRKYRDKFLFRRLFIPSILILLILLLFLFSHKVYANFKGINNEQLILNITINEANNVSGQLIIDFSDLSKKTQNSLIILPFKINNLMSDSGIIVTDNVLDEYSILNIITTPSTLSESRIYFQVSPNVVDISQINFFDLSQKPDYFVIEKRSETQYTLLFRLDTNLSHNPFGALGDLAKNMIAPSKIILNFSKQAYFTAIPQVDTEPYNIYDDPTYPGTYSDNVFTTPINFYQNQPLRINYIIPAPLPPMASLIILIIVALATLIPVFFGGLFPDKVAALITLGVVIVIPLAILTIGIWIGIGQLVGYFTDNYELYITPLLTYLICVSSLFFKIPALLRQRGNPPAPSSNPPAPSSNPPAPSSNPPAPSSNPPATNTICVYTNRPDLPLKQAA